MKRTGKPFPGIMRGLALLLAVAAAGCAHETAVIYGTKVVDTAENRRLIEVCEQYRLAVEKRDTQTLLSLASKNYWDDGGTPTGADDYGYAGLRDVLEARFSRADGIRYTMKYMEIKRVGRNRAAVDVM